MVLHEGGKKHTVKVLLDTGCSIALINQGTTKKLQIPLHRHQRENIIENFVGQRVQGAGTHRTNPVQLQHRHHFSSEVFEVSPMDDEVDIFLPYDWIVRHPPQGQWDSAAMRFTSPSCRAKCTKHESAEFSLTWHEDVCLDATARVIGHVSGVGSGDALEQVPMEFRQYLGVMSKELADALPEHRSYDCKIDLKEGSTAPWGPIYPLSEIELQTLREWLKEMEKTGKIRRSTSQSGSPILFVPKPNGRGLRLCVDYRGLNSITIPNRYPLPLMQELQDRVQGA